MSVYTNVLLIDSSVPDAQVFVSSVNTTTLPIVYSRSTTKTEIRDLLKELTTIQRIGIVFVNAGPLQIFLDHESFITSDNISFMISLIQDFHVEHIDYLGCSTLTQVEWVTYYSTLSATGVIVGASNDATGNLKYGGDWVMESTGENIELIYFTENIEYYTYLLDITDNISIINIYGQLYGCLNDIGKLGINFFGFMKAEIPLYTIDKIVRGYSYTIGISTTGQLYGFGSNYIGQLGISGTFTEFTPIPVPGNPTIVAVACGYNHSIALDSMGKIYGTGQNDYGQLGINGTINEFTPIPVSGNPTIVAVACGYNYSIALDSTGKIYGTGSNDYGQLGIGGTFNEFTLGISSTIKEFTPLPVPGNPTIKAIACGFYYTIALDDSGNLYGTGNNESGQLGISGTINEFTLLPVPGNPTIVSVACGSSHSIALDNSGNLYGTGLNDQAQLGISGKTAEFTPIPVPGNPIIVAIVCGYNHSIALDNSGNVYGTGQNYHGQLGIIGTITEFTKIPISSNPIQAITSNVYENYTVVTDTSGNVYSSGKRQLGLIGRFNEHFVFKPTTILDSTIDPRPCGYYYSIGIHDNGSIYCTGYNNYGQLGI